jgi:hypothetical protein
MDVIDLRKTNQTVGPPSLVTDVENFHTPNGISVVLVDAIYHDLGDLFPAPVANASNVQRPTLFNDASVFLVPALLGTAWTTPQDWIDNDGVGSAALVSLTTLQPESYDDSVGGSYDIQTTFIVLAPIVGPTDFICKPSMSVGAVQMAPSLVSDIEIVIEPDLVGSYGTTTAAVIDDDQVMSSAVLLMIQYLTPSTHVDGEDTLDPDGVAAFGHLMPELGIMDGDIVLASIIVPGDVGLSPLCVDGSEIDYPHDLQASFALSASLVTDDDQSHDVVALPGDVLWQDPDTAHDDAFSGSAMSPGPVGMQAEWFGDTDVLYASTCIPGDANIGPYPYEVLDIVFRATLNQSSIFTMPRYIDFDRFFSARISGGHYHSTQGSRLVGSMSGPAYMVGGMKTHSLKGSIDTAA